MSKISTEPLILLKDITPTPDALTDNCPIKCYYKDNTQNLV